MSQPIVTWLQVNYQADKTTIDTIVRPKTVEEAYDAGEIGNTAAAVEFKNKFGSRPLWDAKIVEAGKSSDPLIGEFLLCNNLKGSVGGGPTDAVADMIHVTLNVTDRNGQSKETAICGDDPNSREADLLFRLFQKTGISTYGWGIYNREDNYNWADIPAEGAAAQEAMEQASQTLPLLVTYGNSQVVHNVAGSKDVSSLGGTIEGNPQNWTGSPPVSLELDEDDLINVSAFKAKTFSVTDSKNYARMQFMLWASSTANAGTIFFIIRANYQYM